MISVSDSFESILNGSTIIADTAIDLLKDEDAVRSIPFVSIVASVYHIRRTIREKHHLEKLNEFIKEIENGTIDETKRQKYLIQWHADKSKREKELEYLIVVIDRYLHKDMARMIAKVYLAYLEGRITWEEVLRYSVVIDRLLPGDYEALKHGNRENVDIRDTEDSVLRLVGLGLMVSHGKDMQMPVAGTLSIPIQSQSDYEITEFGNVFLKIID